MLLLRQCMVPSVNYLLRCMAPTCIDDEARQFDERMLEAAMDRFGLEGQDSSSDVTNLVQSKLTHGGWGLTSAVATSPAAFLGSLAVSAGEAAFAPFQDAPLPDTSQLHGWIADSIGRIQQMAPGKCDEQLPATAATFFTHYTRTNPSAASSLQSTLHAKATEHQQKAAECQLKQQSREGTKRPWAHAKAITASAAWAWKMVSPLEPRMRLSDTEYAIAARLNLGLPPFPDMDALPETCPLCLHRKTKEPASLKDDPWHWLTCTGLGAEITSRHDEVADALQHAALLIGAQVRREVKGLKRDSNIRPDLQLFFPGRMLLTDVAVSHPLTENLIAKRESSGVSRQQEKRRKYSSVAARLVAELLPYSVETCGGMADDAMKLVQAMGEEGEEAMGAWTKAEIMRYIVSLTAAAVQRGNARAVLSGRMKSLRMTAMGRRKGSGKEMQSEEEEYRYRYR